ncbi:RVT_3 domain-containing protein [Cephalotus follicularis]|uniref:RVT_3 domain-containing protein n=1 Tax=Cephalotus follicularis TaxID=3775 RepID=A0A1Q3CU68_CEPFO|nr:RVT_3 domain-containing protein [Cephalotus follicularis]
MPGEGKLNYDGAVYRNGSCSEAGWVFRDCEDVFIAATNLRIVPQKDPPTTEALAIYYGILRGKRRGYHCLIVESDAWVIVEAIKNSDPCAAAYGNIIDDIRELKMEFEICVFRYISKEDNNLAHITTSFVKESIVE